MKFFRKTFRLPKFYRETCSKQQPSYETLDRIDSLLRQESISVVKQALLKKSEFSVMVNLLIEVGDLMNKLERRLYCFLTELKRTKTDPRKYKSLFKLYNDLKPDLTDLMFSYRSFFSGKFSNRQVLDFYNEILTYLKHIGTHLLEFTVTKQNMQSLNYRYKYEQDSSVSKCYSKVYPQVTNLLLKGKPNSQVNQKKYELISKCVHKQHILPQCVQLYDNAVASGSRDVFIMQAFMRIKLLMDTIRKERIKMQLQKDEDIMWTVQQIQRQQTQMDQSIFIPLKKATQGKDKLQKKQIILKNRSCMSPQELSKIKQQQTKEKSKTQQTKQQL